MRRPRGGYRIVQFPPLRPLIRIALVRRTAVRCVLESVVGTRRKDVDRSSEMMRGTFHQAGRGGRGGLRRPRDPEIRFSREVCLTEV